MLDYLLECTLHSVPATFRRVPAVILTHYFKSSTHIDANISFFL